MTTTGALTREPGGAGKKRASELRVQSMALLEQVTSRQLGKPPAAWWARRDLTLAQLHLLMVLHGSGPATVGRLAEALGISLPAASSAIDRLEERGLALRQRDDADRRLVHVAISSQGEELAEEASGYRRAMAQEILAHFDEEELGCLLKVLAAIRRQAQSPVASEPAAG